MTQFCQVSILPQCPYHQIIVGALTQGLVYRLLILLNGFSPVMFCIECLSQCRLHSLLSSSYLQVLLYESYYILSLIGLALSEQPFEYSLLLIPTILPLRPRHLNERRVHFLDGDSLLDTVLAEEVRQLGLGLLGLLHHHAEVAHGGQTIPHLLLRSPTYTTYGLHQYSTSYAQFSVVVVGAQLQHTQVVHPYYHISHKQGPKHPTQVVLHYLLRVGTTTLAHRLKCITHHGEWGA